MQLQIGQSLSHYRIAGKIGAGGMGEVYVAEDLKLGRRVALKILPDELAGDAERRGRFEREAKAIASLNHPNIVTIHSIEQADDVNFLTMEMVEGTTLAREIPKGGMDLSRLLQIGLAMSDAVSAAHRREITHRDLKPDNIMMGQDGRLRILDFGLARMRDEAPEPAPGSELATRAAATASVRTEEGKILGTVAYMSPEQAEGKPVDSRSDIFSIGVILYELATGERPFKGETRISTISSILRDTPASITDLNHSLPRHLGRIVKRCLVKDPERRYGNARELYNDLLELKDEIDSGEVQPVGEGATPAGARRRGPSKLVIVLTFIFAMTAIPAIVAIIVKGRGGSDLPEPAPAPLAASFTQLTSLPGVETHPSLSPDGRMLVYTSRAADNWDIYFQVVGGRKRLNLTEDSPVDDGWPAFSPDGSRIAFVSRRDGGGIFLMGTTGESVRRLTSAGANPSWNPDGTEVLYSTQEFSTPFDRYGLGQIRAVDIDSGVIRNIPYKGDAVQPVMSPNGQRIAFWGLRADGGIRDIWTIPAAGGEAVDVTDDEHTDWNPLWSPDGLYLYFCSARSGSMNVWRVPIDESTGEVRGAPQAVTTGVGSSAFITMAGDGKHLAYLSGAATTNLERVEFDPRKGEIIGSPAWITRGSQSLIFLDVSPDSEWIVYTGTRGQEDIHVTRVDGSAQRQLTNDAARDRGATWSPDGRQIAFYSDRSGSYDIWSVRPDGSGLRQLTDTPDAGAEIPVWSPDGARLALSVFGKGMSEQGAIIDPSRRWDEQTPEKLPPYDVDGAGFEMGDWSPDGRWLAGTHRKSGSDGGGIIVYSLDTRTYTRLTDSGSDPRWIPDSRRLLYNIRGSIYLADRKSHQSRKVYSPLPDGINDVSITLDGRSLFLARTVDNSDLWLMTLE